MPRIRTRSLIAVGLTVGAGLVWTSAASAATITVTTAGDEFNTAPAAGCSLREAVEAANTNAAFGGCPAGGMVADTVELPQGVQLTRNRRRQHQRQRRPRRDVERPDDHGNGSGRAGDPQ